MSIVFYPFVHSNSIQTIAIIRYSIYIGALWDLLKIIQLNHFDFVEEYWKVFVIVIILQKMIVFDFKLITFGGLLVYNVLCTRVYIDIF